MFKRLTIAAVWFLMLPVYAANQNPGLIKDNICKAFEIMHINGVTTTLEGAQSNLLFLSRTYGNVHQDQFIRYGLAYNQTNRGIYDFYQTYVQILAAYPGTTQAEWLQAVIMGQWPNSLPPAAISTVSNILANAVGLNTTTRPAFEISDLTAVEYAILRFHRRASRLAIIGHSQGSLFANAVYDRLMANSSYQIIPENLGLMSVAAFTNTIRSGTYVTSNYDALVGAVRLIFPDILASNTPSSFNGADVVGHNFIAVYLSNPTLKAAVIGKIKTVMDSLRSPNWPPDGDDGSSYLRILGYASWNNCEPGKSIYPCPNGQTTGGLVGYGTVGVEGTQLRPGSYSEIVNLAITQSSTCVALLISQRIARVSAGGPTFEYPPPNIYNCAVGDQYQGAIQIAWQIYSGDGMGFRVTPLSPESSGNAEARVYPYPVCARET